MENFLGKILIFLGIFLVIFGLILVLQPKIPFLGKLPGDIYIQRENFSFYFPLTTGLLISLLLSVLFFIFSKFFK